MELFSVQRHLWTRDTSQQKNKDIARQETVALFFGFKKTVSKEFDEYTKESIMCICVVDDCSRNCDRKHLVRLVLLTKILHRI